MAERSAGRSYDMTEALIAVAAIGCPAAMGAVMWLLLRTWRRSGDHSDPDPPGENGPSDDH